MSGTTVEEAFARLFHLANSLDAEQQRAAQAGLSQDELAFFDLPSQAQLSTTDRQRLKQASKSLLASLQESLKSMENWTQKEQTQAEVKVFILDRLFETLPNPPYSAGETKAAADRIYEYVRQRQREFVPMGYSCLTAHAQPARDTNSSPYSGVSPHVLLLTLR